MSETDDIGLISAIPFDRRIERGKRSTQYRHHWRRHDRRNAIKITRLDRYRVLCLFHLGVSSMICLTGT